MILPFLFESVLQHFDAPNKIGLEIFLAFPLALEKSYSRLKSNKLDVHYYYKDTYNLLYIIKFNENSMNDPISDAGRTCWGSKIIKLPLLYKKNYNYMCLLAPQNVGSCRR